MSMPFVRRWIIAALCVAFGLLAGCGVLRLGYGQADAFAFRWLDGYADFDGAQALRVREGLARWFGWHRRTQLPDYAELLLRIEPELRQDTTAERVCGWWSHVRERIDRGLDAAVPAFAELAPTLRPEQFEHIERRYAKANAEYRDEFLSPDPRRRLVESAKRVAGRAEWLYGDLDDAQRTRIAEWVQESPFDPAGAYEERLHRQEEGLALLRRLATAPMAREAAEQEIRAWLRSFDRSPRLRHRLRTERLVRHNCALAAALHNSTSPAQREAASKRLLNWAADFRALAAEGG
jgi:hypothetical protein